MNYFHLTMRVHNLERSVDFYTWLFGIPPDKKYDGRYAVFLIPERHLNFVVIQTDYTSSTMDRIHHIGLSVDGRDAVIDLQSRAYADGYDIQDYAKTTWHGTPMHQLWLVDPDGVKIEIYSKLTDEELGEMPEDKEPVLLPLPKNQRKQ
ncbi:MAG: VOC family protein [Gammaproteobacteria bacterium]|nr:VOC family protein [Gammaproteobacteria bacterium]